MTLHGPIIAADYSESQKDEGRLPSAPSCQPTASAVPASQSGIPDADDADIRWLARQADYADDPAEIAALALIGLQMVERRRAAKEGRPERNVTARYLNDLGAA